MERTADVEAHRAFGASFPGEFHRPLDTRHLTADHDLIRGIVVGRHDETGLTSSLLAHRFDCRRERTENGGHGAGPTNSALIHQLTASPNDLQRALEGKRRRS